jgi:hypothetical protein
MENVKRLKDWLQGKAPLSAKRSSKWSKVRAEHLLKEPICMVCGSDKQIEVHHMKPFNTHPELELEPSNLITLCESKKRGVDCHRFFGHLGNYKLINPDVINDCKCWKDKLLTTKND